MNNDINKKSYSDLTNSTRLYETLEIYGISSEDIDAFDLDSHKILSKALDLVQEALEDEKNNDSERLCLIKSFLEYNKLLIQNNLDKLITKDMSDDFLN